MLHTSFIPRPLLLRARLPLMAALLLVLPWNGTGPAGTQGDGEHPAKPTGLSVDATSGSPLKCR